MNEVTLILPQDITILEKKYAQVLAQVVAELLTPEELQYLASELERKDKELEDKKIC